MTPLVPKKLMIFVALAGSLLSSAFPTPSSAQSETPRSERTIENPGEIEDDDFQRYKNWDWKDLSVKEVKFREQVYDWTFYLLESKSKPAGPAWIVIHDSEDPAFESALNAIGHYGGRMLVVSTSGKELAPNGGFRSQKPSMDTDARLRCISDKSKSKACDPNRAFPMPGKTVEKGLPKFAAEIQSVIQSNHPVIAFHTNETGIYRKGKKSGNGSVSVNGDGGGRKTKNGDQNEDTMIILPVPVLDVSNGYDSSCGKALNKMYNIKYESMKSRKDGSLSFYINYKNTGVKYFNLESRYDFEDPSLSSASKLKYDAAVTSHGQMLKSVMEICVKPGLN